MFSFYCNQCFRRRKYETSLQLFVSRCGHILCSDCVRENCRICSRPFNGVAITKHMHRSMADYFSSPIKQYQHFKKVMRFHREQRSRLADYLCRFNDKEKKKVQDEIHSFAKLNQSIKRKIQHERERIRKFREYTYYYDKRLEQAQYMTPPITSQRRSGFRVQSRRVKKRNSDRVKRLTPVITPNILTPNSPTLSSSVLTEETIFKPTAKRKRTPPDLLPCSQHKPPNLEFSLDSF